MLHLPRQRKLGWEETEADCLLFCAGIKKLPIPAYVIHYVVSRVLPKSNPSNYKENLITAFARLKFSGHIPCNARFNEACAEELGRLCQANSYVTLSGLTVQQLPVKKEATHLFSKCLLMPRIKVQEACAGGPLYRSDRPLLSHLFAVTESSIDERLADLQIEYKGEEPNLRIPYATIQASQPLIKR